MKVFYPKTTNEIMHKGKTGKIYRLDGFDKLVLLHDTLVSDCNYDLIEVDAEFENNTLVGTKLINLIHSPRIIEAYKTGLPLELAESSGIMWQPKIYNQALEQALICKIAVDNTQYDKTTIALTGGGHHAEYDTPFGFCLINTMALTAIYAQETYKYKTILIDLDTHYSNGCFDILQNKKDVFCTSLWNQKLEKWKDFNPNEENIWHRKCLNSDEYFKNLKKLKALCIKFNPDLIIYHLGLDVLETDRMGGVQGMNNEKLNQRERLMIELFKQLSAKLIVFFGGAYINHANTPLEITNQKVIVTEILKESLDKLITLT